ncbi:M56 family metallopeptidase [Paludisphaera mucosa]|uniref:M56 family metallopeptidase n=1 Tax=Paludisphaera mucosa TaxID=3030827 RepID=A0ABT6FBH1_9BACT|nr:M56 family metallopeptidase [Paludisphaera mucosa]MDG3004789.1 M56 family metallopeptidase [Paludisphaera mucosa]
MNIPTTSPAWTALGWTFLHMLWIGAAVGLVASLARRLLRRAAAETRHAAALTALIGLAIAPFAAFFAVYDPAPPTAAARPAEVVPRIAFAVDANSRVAYEFAPSPARPTGAPESIRMFRFLDPWVAILPGVWFVGSLLTLASLATGLVGVERLRRAGLPLESGPIVERCRELARSLGIAREVGIAACDRIAAPVLIGIVRPLILLPTAALTGWDPDQVEMALLHELAHLRRRDNLTSLFQKLVEALLFFHPTTWWLSAWVRLERETCCDRLVVARTGRPRAYAELLAALAGARPAAPAAASLTERPIATRIRRILLKEDRPMTMKPTAPEALALCAAALLAAALALPTRAEPPDPKAQADHDVRATLKRLAEAAAVTPAPKEDNQLRYTLLTIAESQLGRDDRPGALETLGRVVPPKLPDRAAPFRPRDRDVVESIVQIAILRDKAGDAEGSRAMVRELIGAIQPTDVMPSPGAARLLEAQVSEAMSRSIGVAPDGSPVVVEIRHDEEVRRAGGGEEPDATAKELNDRIEALFSVMQQAPEIVGAGETRRLVDQALKIFEPVQGPARPVVLASYGRLLLQAGDVPRGRERIAEARRLALALPDARERDSAMHILASVVGQGGPAAFDDGLALASSLQPPARAAALTEILNGLCHLDTALPTDAGSILISLDAPLRPYSKPLARVSLPRLADAARSAGDARSQARLLSTVARLQAMRGDVAEGLATAESISDVRRADDPGPSDGDYDAVKPATFAHIAQARSEAGDRAGADASFTRSAELARGVVAADQQLVAWYVLARRLEATGRRDAARAVVAEAIPKALAQPEPRRSRLLCLFAEVQIETDGVARATQTVEAIRDEPGLEKARGLRSLAVRLRKDGDDDGYQTLTRRALVVLEPRPTDPPRDKSVKGYAFTPMAYYDLDREVPPRLIGVLREFMAHPMKATLEAEKAPAPDPSTLSPGQRDQSRAAAILQAYRRSGTAPSPEQIEAFETPAGRLVALQSLASSLSSDVTRK